VKTLLVVSVIALASAGCSGQHNDPGAAAKPTPSCELVDGECLPTTKVSDIPVLPVTVGQPFKYQIPTAEGAADLELTVLSVKTKSGTSSDPKHSVTLCLNVKVRNVGTVAIDANDTDAQTQGKWFGLDGQQADANPATMQTCSPRGTEWGGIDQPVPLPGKYVAGMWMYNVPDRPGALEVTDSAGHPLYRLNYGPKSAQVPINEVGQ
jgi:hypothetical protein